MYESFACLEFVINVFKCENTCAAKIHVSLDECYHDDDSTELCSFSKVLIDFIAWNLKKLQGCCIYNTFNSVGI